MKFLDIIDESSTDDSYIQEHLPLIVHSLVVAHDVLPRRLGGLSLLYTLFCFF